MDCWEALGWPQVRAPRAPYRTERTSGPSTLSTTLCGFPYPQTRAYPAYCGHCAEDWARGRINQHQPRARDAPSFAGTRRIPEVWGVLRGLDDGTIFAYHPKRARAPMIYTPGETWTLARNITYPSNPFHPPPSRPTPMSAEVRRTVESPLPAYARWLNITACHSLPSPTRHCRRRSRSISLLLVEVRRSIVCTGTRVLWRRPRALTDVGTPSGIAGLACALALRRVGHHVLVLERTDRSSAVRV